MPTYASRLLPGRSVTRVTTGMPAATNLVDGLDHFGLVRCLEDHAL